MKYKQKGDNSRYIYVILKGLLISFALTMLIMVIFTILLTFTKISENMITIFNSIAIIASIVIGAVYSSYKANRKGWIVGGIIGFCYIIIILLVSSMINKGITFNLYVVIKMLIVLVVGIVGGMIGVNLK